MSAYTRGEHRDQLFPEGRPECSNSDGRPVYLAGLCGSCFAEERMAREAVALVDAIMATPHTIALSTPEGLEPLVLTRPAVRDLVAHGKGDTLLRLCMAWCPTGCPNCGQDLEQLGGNAECQVCAGEPAAASPKVP